MHHTRLQPRAETRCTFGLRDDADKEFCWKGNCVAGIDHESEDRVFISERANPERNVLENADAPAGFRDTAASCESQESLSLRLNYCRNPQ